MTNAHFWRDKRVFVTGCSGFLGSWTIKELHRRGELSFLEIYALTH